MRASSVAATGSKILANLGLDADYLGLDPANSRNKRISDGKEARTVAGWIEYGSILEDNLLLGTILRVRHHFYDPLYDRPLTVLGAAIGEKSPDWALEDRADFGNQAFSFRHARDYLYKALTLPDEQERKKNFGLTFQTLGHVIHHIQDMAQPQHARNDIHPSVGSHKSLYEDYTNDHRDNLPYTGYAPAIFTTARAFWTANGTGIADYTNHNFLSAGTNFDTQRYPSPFFSPATEREENANSLLADAGLPIPAECSPPADPCVMTFYGNLVQDRYRPAETRDNPRASTWSLFDQDLERYNQTFTRTDPDTGQTYTANHAFSLNRFNFDEAHTFLIPSAVGYSAGLIDYFFRGRLEIGLPDDGVYAVVDHGTAPGFAKIKLKLNNATPDIPSSAGPVPQAMARGQLIAIAKFHRNDCYQPDLSGEFNSAGRIWNGCRAYRNPTEEIVLSAPLEAVGVGTAPQAFTFDFSANPIPFGATDLYLQVVYRGILGEENDVVVVATQDVSEPTYISILNSTDYFLIDGTFHRPEAIKTTPSLLANVDDNGNGKYDSPPDTDVDPLPLSYRFGFGGAVVGEATLPPARYMRIALLTNPAAYTFYLVKDTFGYTVEPLLTPRLVQINADTGRFDVNVTYRTRGFYRLDLLPDWKFIRTVNGDTSVMDDLADVAPYPVAINF